MRVSHLAAALLVLAVRAAAEAPPLPEPGTPGSHERYLEALSAANEAYAEELAARYDRRLAEAPDDLVAATERCRFLDAAFPDPKTDRHPGHTACLEDVERRFAGDPSARVFAIEQRWGDEALEAGEAFLAEPPEGTTPAQLAAVHAHLARALDLAGEGGVAPHAEQAMALDPTLDLRLFVADERIAEGDREGARAALSEGLLATRASQGLERKAVLLAELGAHDLALSAFRELERRGAELTHPEARAQALAGVGEIEAAREAFAGLLEDEPDADALRAHFEFQLAHGDAQAARAAYDALRDVGFEEDAFGGGRIALLFAHPGAPWRWRDVTGLALLAGIAFLISLVPALWILPIVWAGLGRERAAAAPGGFTLRHAWSVSAAYLFAEVITVLALAGVGLGGFEADWPSDPESVARSTAVSSAVALAAVLLVVRGRVRDLFARGSWSWRRTLLLMLVLGVALQAGEALFLHLVEGEAEAAETLEMVRAVSTSYGLGASLALIAVLVPIVEEVMFRGVLLGAFARHLSPGAANFAQATMFGLAHVDPIAIPFSFALGLVAGWTTRRSGTLWTALGLHALGNAWACFGVAFG